jgi:hypothetical protein
MQAEEEILLPELNPEELKLMSKMLVDAFLHENAQADFTLVTCVYGYEIIKEDQITQVISLDLISSATASIYDPLGQLKKWFSSILNSISSWIVSAIRSTLDWLYDHLRGAISWIYDGLRSFVSGVYDGLRNAISSLWSSVSGAFSSLWNSISGSLSNLWTSISSGLSSLGDSLQLSISNAFSGITDYLFRTFTSISDFISSLGTSITNAISTLGTTLSASIETIATSLGGIITDATTILSDSIIKLGTTLSAGLTSLMDYMGTYVIPSITGAFTTLSTFLDTYVVKPIYTIGSIVATGFAQIAKTTMGFINGVIQAGQWITNAIQQIGTWIWQALPDWLRGGLEAIGTFFKGIADAVTTLFKDPASYLGKLSASVWGFLKEIGGKIWEGLNWIWSTLVATVQNIVKTVWGAIQEFGAWLWNSIIGAFKSIGQTMFGGVMTTISAVGETLIKSLSGMISEFLKIAQTGADVIGKKLTDIASLVFASIYNAFSKGFAEQTTSLAEKFTKSTPQLEEIGYAFEGTGLIITEVIGAHYLAFGLSQTLHAFASFCDELRTKPEIRLAGEGEGALEPLGLGTKLRSLLGYLLSLGWHIKPSYIFRELAKDVRELSDTFTRGLMYGIAIWSTNPLVRLFNVAFRDVFVIELPTTDVMQEIVRRQMPTEKFEEVLKNYQTILKLYGYRTSVIEWLTSTEIKFTVTDRFGAKRTIPLSLLYELPSASDVARMAIRDIFGMGAEAIESFLKVYSARGMHPDIGTLYYLLHYRYPPPERLWTFISRGWSGMLWATIPQDLMDRIEAEAKKLGAPIPTPAVNWNFKAKELLTALQTYMTWHDYFDASWIRKEMFGWSENFTSDIQIMLDTLADIPTKIDQRWMVKWGLYELLKNKQVTLQSPVSDFRTKIVEGEAKSKIQLDLTNFSRTLQATGIHPDWIPLTAVGEAMNVLTEERITLRTGFINLFKEGFWDTDSIETLLAGAITASFAVSYFDITKLEWGKGWVNQPVMFLPAERKLIELRALTDRAFDILRETQRDVSRGYSEWIIESYDEYKERLTKIIESINEFFSADYKAITGVELPEKLKLTFVEEYYKPYIESLNIWRDIFTVRRIRYWTQRWLGWILYRIATGVVSKEEYERLIAYVVNYAKLTPTEKEYLEGVFDVLQGIAVKQSQSEYIPTPTMLATICEIIPKAREYFDDVVVAKRIPEKWVPIWADYVDYKPLVDEIKKMVSRAENLYTYFIVTEEDYKKVLDQVQFIGYTPKEIEYMLYNSRLERFRRAWAELIGDVDRMTMLAEYSPRARDFALGQLYKMIDALPIAQDTKALLKEMWEQFIRLKPVMDEVRRYVTDLINAFVDGTISELTFSNELEALKEWGLDDYEIMFYKAIASLRKARKLRITIG